MDVATMVAEAGGVPEGSPPRQAGEDRGRPRQDGVRRDGGAVPSQEEEAAREQTERVQVDEAPEPPRSDPYQNDLNDPER
jgi:hypothetical protein